MKKSTQTQDAAQQGQQPAQGFFSDVRAYVSHDGEYLTIVFPGGRVRKSRNWFLSLLNLPYTPKARQPRAPLNSPADDAPAPN